MSHIRQRKKAWSEREREEDGKNVERTGTEAKEREPPSARISSGARQRQHKIRCNLASVMGIAEGSKFAIVDASIYESDRSR